MQADKTRLRAGFGGRNLALVDIEEAEAASKPAVDSRKRYVYAAFVIRTFASAETEEFFHTGKSRRLPPDIRARASKRLLQLNAATAPQDLRLPPSNNLERLVGERKGQWSIRINKQWRVCFRFENGDTFEVEIVDYHA